MDLNAGLIRLQQTPHIFTQGLTSMMNAFSLAAFTTSLELNPFDEDYKVTKTSYRSNLQMRNFQSKGALGNVANCRFDHHLPGKDALG